MIVTEFLSLQDYKLYGNWLKIQDAETRNLYFGVASNDYVIDSLMERILKSPQDHYFLVAKDGTRWVGTIHIAVSGKQVEFGVIVDNEYRGRGIGGDMLEESLLWARNRRYRELYMHCLTWNAPIRHLCDKHGLKPKSMFGESEVQLELPPPDFITLAKEANIKNRNIFHTWLQDNTRWYQEIYG